MYAIYTYIYKRVIALRCSIIERERERERERELILRRRALSMILSMMLRPRKLSVAYYVQRPSATQTKGVPSNYLAA